MRAMVLDRPRTLRAAELPEPEPGPGEIKLVVERGEGAERFEVGARVGVPWLGWADGTCRYCREGRENLCEHARFTGYDIDGGNAEFSVAAEDFCFPIPDLYSDAHPLPGRSPRRGGASSPYTRDGDTDGQAFARSLGAEWAGGSSNLPPDSDLARRVPDGRYESDGKGSHGGYAE